MQAAETIQPEDPREVFAQLFFELIVEAAEKENLKNTSDQS